MIQRRFIEYSKVFARDNGIDIWLSGSFLKGGFTKYSDVDLAVKTDDADAIRRYINGFGPAPVYVGRTERPNGILIVIYEGGLALDIEIIENIGIADETLNTEGCFHVKDIKALPYVRNEMIWRELVTDDSKSYRIMRLFHRSLIKALSGKAYLANAILNEISDFLGAKHIAVNNEYEFKFRIIELLDRFKKKYFIQIRYYNELCRLIRKL